jgi:DNA-binding NtrC family response regulator
MSRQPNGTAAARDTMKLAKILIADDESAITTGLAAILEDAGYVVEVVADGQKALDKLSAERYGVVLADLKMPKLDGLALLRELQQRDIPTECIIITGQATVDSAVQAMQQGAYDYIEKPLNAEKLNRLKALIPKALDKYQVQQKNRELSSKLEGLTHYGELTGQSESMRSVYQVIEAVAPSTASVLILGESGTGKELVARALHTKSDRAKGPFFALNCAALPKEILENELFGHEKGAFTGSTNEKAGAFEMSSGGTIFLDEMAEMPPDIQVKLLRAIETRQIRRLGGKKEINVDIRIVAATNKNLQKAIADGELREDLYYRLAVVEIDLPPLRERADDIQLLANEFLARFAQQNGKTITGFEDQAWEWIISYHWPGNVRELKNALERAVIMSRGSTISATDIIPRHLRAGGEMPAALTIPVGATAAEARQQLVLRTFASTSGDAARTGKVLGLSEQEVRSELFTLLNGAGAPVSGSVTEAAPPPAAPPAASRPSKRSEPAAAPGRASAKKTPARKGR